MQAQPEPAFPSNGLPEPSALEHQEVTPSPGEPSQEQLFQALA